MPMKKDIHLTGSDLINMCQVRVGDLGKYALVPGPIERLKAILRKIENPIKNFSFFEYSMYTGTYEGIKVSAGNGGRYNADNAICAEMLCAAGVPNIIRTGTCGALEEKMQIGDMIITTDVIRGDGVTPYYVKDDFKTKADSDIVKALIEAAKLFKVAYHVGTTWTTDAFLRETRELIEEIKGKGGIAVDMVTSAILTIAQINKVRAGSIMVVSDNLMTGEMGFVNPKYYDGETKMIDVAMQAIKILEGR